MKKIVPVVLIAAFILYIGYSFLVGFGPGMETGHIFTAYCIEMATILPLAFVLIGLFEVWIKREIVEKHLGHGSGIRGYFWAILLGGTTIGPMIVSLPIAYSLSRKGAALNVVFTYIGAAAVCRIPMTIFEASYLGVKFTVIRYVVSIPLIIISASILGSYLQKHNFKIQSEDI